MAQAPFSRRKVCLLALVLASAFRLLEWALIGSPVQFPSVVSEQGASPSTLTSATATPRPRNLRLVLIGDSLTRYSYLSLAYFLRWGHWYDPSILTPHLVQASSFESLFHNQTWGQHSWETNRMLYPLEICDCYRKSPGQLQVNKVASNRYFYDPQLDNFVTYMDAKGHKGSLHGRITAYNVTKLLTKQRQQTDGTMLSAPFDSLQRPFAWVHTSWSEAIQQYVAQLDPKPTHVVMNAGLWPNNFLYQPILAEDIVQELDSINAKGIWKTTSYGKGGTVLYESIPNTDQLMCAKLRGCWDLSWTKGIADSWYWDDKHFYEPVYRIMNEDFLEQMGFLPEGYQKLDRSFLFGGTHQK